MVLALNRISAHKDTFLRNALRYLYSECLCSVVPSFTIIYKRNFEISLDFYKKGIIMLELKAGLNGDKFATFWMLPKSFYHSFVLQMTYIHSTTG